MPKQVFQSSYPTCAVTGTRTSRPVSWGTILARSQTAPLIADKVKIPVIALGGEKSLGAKVPQMVAMVATSVEGYTIADCGHFIPEEQPEEVVTYVRKLAERVARQ